MCAAEILGMAAFAAFPALLPRLRETWAMSNTAAGWVSGMYFAGYLVAVGVLMPLTDRRDPRRIYLACMGLSALAALGFAFMAAGAASASLWSFLQGVGLAGTYMPGLKALADLMPERWQSRAVAFYT
ncbi:MAG: MFS transporter, partial [Gammaproteobacteria bacterium]